jgi:hypothetical protein
VLPSRHSSAISNESDDGSWKRERERAKELKRERERERERKKVEIEDGQEEGSVRHIRIVRLQTLRRALRQEAIS